MKRTKAEILNGISNITESKIINNNTVWYKLKDGTTKIRLHLTDIVTRQNSGDIILNSGGWKTITTKDRLNSFLQPLGFYISQQNSVWYIKKDGKDTNYIFNDGMIITNNGDIKNTTIKNEKKTEDLKKKVNEYVKNYVNLLVNRKLPQPTNGDCWYCLMKTEDGRTLGDVSSSDHMLNHLKEKYYVPSILANAVEEFGMSQVNKHTIGYWWKYHDSRLEAWEDYTKKQVTKVLRRYIYRRVGLAS